MYDRILVPLDGSTEAEIALPYAEEIAVRFAAELILVSVSEPTGEEKDDLYLSYLERVKERVRGQLQEWGAKEGAKLRSEVLLGRPANQILTYAEENTVSLIVMASRGRSGHGPWLLGNIAAKILRAINKPVLLVRVPPAQDRVQEKRLVKRILLPLDGSDIGEAAFPYAEALALGMPAELILFQVLRPAVLIAEGSTMVSGAVYEKQEEIRKAHATAYLDNVAGKAEEKRLSISKALVSGYPPERIIDYAQANAIDLIAMSTHGRSGISRWVFGSVTDKVLHAGDTPVLTVRAQRD